MEIEEKYDLLNPEKKEEFKVFIENLVKGQYILEPFSGSPR